MKKALVSILFLLIFASSSFADKYSFAVFGDTQGQYLVFKDIVKAFNISRDINFGILTGDITGYGRNSEFEEYLSIKKTCKVPIYEIIGNHDIHILSGHGIEFMKKYYGSTYYYMDLDNIRYVMLNNSSTKGLGKEQWDWLNKTLDTKKTLLVFMHKPVIDATGYHSDHVMAPEKERLALNKLLISKKVKYIFSGHIHGYGRMEENGVIYIVAAGGGAGLYLPAFAGGFFHYVKVTVNGDRISDEVVPLYND